jgi:type II secretory pathway component PulF
LDSGVDILNSLNLVSRISANQTISSMLLDIRTRLEGGMSLAAALNSADLIPQMARRMILLGEKSGKVSASLIRLSQIYEKQTRSTMNAIGGMIEPILIILIGAVVLFFALGIFLPMWDMIKVVQ